MDTRDELTGLREYIAALEAPGIQITRDGEDVTRQEIEVLKGYLEYLETVLLRLKINNDKAP